MNIIHATPSPILESSTVNFDLLKDKTPAPENAQAFPASSVANGTL